MRKDIFSPILGVAAVLLGAAGPCVPQKLTANEAKAVVGSAPVDPGPTDATLSPRLTPGDIKSAMRKVATWQLAQVAQTPSQDWTFATLYMGFLAASRALKDSRYHDAVLGVGNRYRWTLGPRQTHADDQAIGQAYLTLYRETGEISRIASLRQQFDQILQTPDDPNRPVWWWCDALFMAPPVWAELAEVTGDPKYLAYMDHQWHVTSDLLWDPNEHLFSRDAGYLSKREKNGRKVFWSRGNGWVMGGLVGVLQQIPSNDRRRHFYENRLRAMADAVANIQGRDGLWRAGLLDPEEYPNPEVSGSAFFLYAMTWGMEHGLLDPTRYEPVVERGWAGILHHIYADGRLGDIQPVGEAPGAYTPSSSYVFGVGAFLLAGSELSTWAAKPQPRRHTFRANDGTYS